MRTVTRFAAIVGLTLLLCGCGGSGGSGSSGVSDGESSCGHPDCGRDTDPPPAASPTPSGNPDPAAPLRCGGAEGVGCPADYHCVADPTATCDAATGMDCAGLCVLGDELPRCGAAPGEQCPEGYACMDDPDDDCVDGPAADCPGVCRPAAPNECVDDAGCAAKDAPCTFCTDGSLHCAKVGCVNGACAAELEPCGEQTSCGGITGATCLPGFECVDDPNDMCTPDNGADCPGTCQPATGGECTSDEECPPLRAPCSVCADGEALCPKTFCDGGRCVAEYPSCPQPPGCVSDADCGSGQTCVLPPDGMCDPATGAPGCGGLCVPETGPRPCGGADGATCPPGYECSGAAGEACQPDANGSCAGICVPDVPPACHTADDCVSPQPCTTCPDGTPSCEQAECLNGMCVLKHPLCSDPGRCTSDAECAVPQSCNTCPNGTYSCAQGQCRNGACIAFYPPCPEPNTCGGAAGISCLPGFTCVDSDGDDCDPNQGGADCTGVCRREDEPRKCGSFTGETCPPGYECADAPNDDCAPDSGGADCPGFCRPAVSPACASDSDCPLIGAPCHLCADGTAACPRSFCENGQCRADFPSCERGMEPHPE